MTAARTSTDVLIVGAGPCGMTPANLLGARVELRSTVGSVSGA
jgi:ribulose 1,5-bisphosphate synthetase/thiazole synthase